MTERRIPTSAPRRDRDGLLVRAHRLDTAMGRRAWRALTADNVLVLATVLGPPPMALLATDGRDDLAPWWNERVIGGGQSCERDLCVDVDRFAEPGKRSLALLTLRTTIVARGRARTLSVTFDLDSRCACGALAAAADETGAGVIQLVREQDQDADEFKSLQVSLGTSGMAAVRRALRCHWLTVAALGLVAPLSAAPAVPPTAPATWPLTFSLN